MSRRVNACLCVCGHTCCTSFELMSEAGSSYTALCSSFPLVFIVSSKKNKVEMCRVRKTCSIFLKEEKEDPEIGPEGSSSLYPWPDHAAPLPQAFPCRILMRPLKSKEQT